MQGPASRIAGIAETIQAILASLAILAPAVWGLGKWLGRRWGRVSWGVIERATLKLHRKMTDSGYRPGWIVCLGRSGAFVGAILSERFGIPTIPLAVLNFQYRERHSNTNPSSRVLLRDQRALVLADFKDPHTTVLVVGIDIVTGSTMRTALEYLSAIGIVLSQLCLPLLESGSTRYSHLFCREAAEDLVNWMQQADENRAELRELHELYVSRMDARFAEAREASRADLAELRQEMQAGFAKAREDLQVGLSRVETKLEQRTADLMKWSFVFWVGAVGAIAVLAGVLR